MNREEYLRELSKYLKKLPKKDYDDTMNYFEEYFDEVVLLNKLVIASGSVKDVFTEDNINKAYRV